MGRSATSRSSLADECLRKVGLQMSMTSSVRTRAILLLASALLAPFAAGAQAQDRQSTERLPWLREEPRPVRVQDQRGDIDRDTLPPPQDTYGSSAPRAGQQPQYGAPPSYGSRSQTYGAPQRYDAPQPYTPPSADDRAGAYRPPASTDTYGTQSSGRRDDAYRPPARRYDDPPPARYGEPAAPPRDYDAPRERDDGDSYRAPRERDRYASNAPYDRYDNDPPPRDGTFSMREIVETGHGFFGSVSQGLASVIEYAFKTQGRPNGYILGEDVGGAFVAGLRYGQGRLHTRDSGSHSVFWQGPSIGYDAGAEGSKVMVLIYNLSDPSEIYQRFGGADGSAYVVGGVGLTIQKRDDIVLAPIRAGVGLRLGANVGYLKYTRRPTWNPF